MGAQVVLELLSKHVVASQAIAEPMFRVWGAPQFRAHWTHVQKRKPKTLESHREAPKEKLHMIELQRLASCQLGCGGLSL